MQAEGESVLWFPSAGRCECPCALGGQRDWVPRHEVTSSHLCPSVPALRGSVPGAQDVVGLCFPQALLCPC